MPKAKRQKCELMGWKPKMQIHDVYKQENSVYIIYMYMRIYIYIYDLYDIELLEP